MPFCVAKFNYLERDPSQEADKVLSSITGPFNTEGEADQWAKKWEKANPSAGGWTSLEVQPLNSP